MKGAIALLITGTLGGAASIIFLGLAVYGNFRVPDWLMFTSVLMFATGISGAAQAIAHLFSKKHCRHQEGENELE